jgi:hypothetical protein
MKLKSLYLTLSHYKCPSWNQIAGRGHWTKRADMMEYAHSSVREALEDGTMENFTTPVTITVTAYLKRPIDCDNVSCKGLIDGLRMFGVIKDDTIKYVKSVTTKVIKSKTDYTEIDVQST